MQNTISILEKTPLITVALPRRHNIQAMTAEQIMAIREQCQQMLTEPAQPAAGRLTSHDLSLYTLADIEDVLEERELSNPTTSDIHYLRSEEPMAQAA